jgi:hypothetical protein
MTQSADNATDEAFNNLAEHLAFADSKIWESKAWSGLTSFSGQNVWSDGTDIYCSTASDQYVLNKATSTWSAKTWNGLTSFNGAYIWKDGSDIYYSNSSSQYALDKATSTWSAKTWSGLTSFNGQRVWSDGTYTYSSNGGTQHVLNLAVLSDSEFAFRRSASDTWKKVTMSDIKNYLIKTIEQTFAIERR